MESYAEQGAGADSIEQIGFGGARRTKKKHRGLTVYFLSNCLHQSTHSLWLSFFSYSASLTDLKKSLKSA